MGKKTVRYGCFETNSSSEHSIIVTSNNKHVKIKPWSYKDSNDEPDTEYYYIHNGEWRVSDVADGFGRWPMQFLVTFEDKLRYALSDYLGNKYGDEDDYDYITRNFDTIVKEAFPGFDHFDFHMKDVDIYLDENGNELQHKDLKYDHYDAENDTDVYSYIDRNGDEKIAKLSDECYEIPEIGSVDHQSKGLLINFLVDHEISLKEFLTNKKYVILVTGDEYNDFENLMKSGLINADVITEIYKKSDEDVEWLTWSKENKEDEENEEDEESN